MRNASGMGRSVFRATAQTWRLLDRGVALVFVLGAKLPFGWHHHLRSYLSPRNSSKRSIIDRRACRTFRSYFFRLVELGRLPLTQKRAYVSLKVHRICRGQSYLNNGDRARLGDRSSLTAAVYCDENVHGR